MWGMDYASLAKIKPDIICVSMSGLGHTGPRCELRQLRADAAGAGGIHAADGGCARRARRLRLLVRRHGGRLQRRAGGADRAVASPAHRARPVRRSLAVRGGGQRRRSGAARYRGQRPQAGSARMALAGSARRAARRLSMPAARRRRRPLDRDRGAHAGRVGALRGAIGIAAWTVEAKFRTLYLRMRNREELDAHVARWAADSDAEDAMARLQRAGVAAGVVLNGADLCERDPQLAERGFLAPVKLPDNTTTQVTGVPMRLSATPARSAPWRPSRRGQRLRAGRAAGARARRARGTHRRGRGLGLTAELAWASRARMPRRIGKSVQIHQPARALAESAIAPARPSECT